MNLWTTGHKKDIKNALIGLGTAAFFSLLYVLPVLGPLEDKVYDFFLRFRAKRERITDVVFLDVDDAAVAYNGVFPWPRSITAAGLLRLKEYGARAAIFDIEYIDNGPLGVDNIYLDQGLYRDFTRSFEKITSDTSDVLSAIKRGRTSRSEIEEFEKELFPSIFGEREDLYEKARTVSRNDDDYLAQASALFGKSWVTLNLSPIPLTDEK